jgi:Fe-S cluster assembly ATP-binding protein
MPALLEVRGLALRLGGETILGDIDLTVDGGEIHALLGTNGAGKSSLAFAVMGCDGYRPDVGRIYFDGRDLDCLPMYERARLGITLAWQEPARFEGISVRDYLEVGIRNGHPADYLARVGLDPERYLHRPVDRTLSGGERKRVELAAVAAMRPRLAILDEPAAGIDLLSLADIVGVIEAMNRGGAAILLITHQESVAARAHRASQISGGRIVCRGEARRVIENYKSMERPRI